MVGVLFILILLAIFTTVGFVFGWMVHMMARPEENSDDPAILVTMSEATNESV